MKSATGILLQCSLFLSLSMLANASTVWNEHNAGATIAKADITGGSGVLTDIAGALGNTTTGADFYEIYITNPNTFSAITTGNTKKPVIDPALYLFDSAGNGLFGEDNISSGNKQAALPAGTLTGLNPGLYFLLIAPSGHVPDEKHGNSIFGAITGTTGVVAGSGVLKNYGGTPSADDAGKGYDIKLTGARFAVPEPATFGFTVVGIALLGWRSRRRSRQA
jgi:hypothetical protein